MNMLKIAAASIAAAAAVPAVAAPPAADYVMQAGAGDAYEKESSQLVLRSTQDANVRRFAQMMVTDHNKSTADVAAAAKQDGLRPTPPRLDAQGRADVAALRGASGTARDGLYINQQKASHQKALALHEDYASTGDRPALKAAAAAITPVVRSHGEMLNDMGGAAAAPM